MKQICNTSYAIQADAFVEEEEFEAWDKGLDDPPKQPERKRSGPMDVPLGGELGGLGFGGVGNV